MDKSGTSKTESLDSILNELNVHFEIDDTEFKRIPKEGAFITISNHPLGSVGGLLLLKAISKYRDDFKLLDSFLHDQYPILSEKIIPISPFDKRISTKKDKEAYQYAKEHLESGSPIGIFPAGENSNYDRIRNIQDKIWRSSVIKYIKNAEVPVVPIYFHSNKTATTHLLRVINPIFRSIRSTKEQSSRSIPLRIGQAIPVDVQNNFSNLPQYGRFLRAKTYALGSPLEVKRFFNYKIKKQVKQEKIVDRGPEVELIKEIKTLRKDFLLFNSGKYEVFCTPSLNIPFLMNEIGRLREIAFRNVGEGTNRSIDIDEFDLYYEQLFIWDSENNQITGAYRVGKGKDIIRQFGKKGFYLDSLFNIKNEFNPILEESLELGRSFVSVNYQKNPIALFLLWKGILYLLLKHEEYRYLIGPVSISNDFSNFSKSMIIKFIKTHYYHHEFARFVKPRQRFKVNYKNIDHQMIIDSVNGDLNKFDKMIEEIEPNHYRFPVLFKKYLKQNARILGFNVDPRFNMALDGLIILDLLDVPMNTIRSLSKELNDKSLLDRFESQILFEDKQKENKN